MKTLRLGALLCAFLFAQNVSILAQGALTPPGAPAALFKTLQQLEPRTPIDIINVPGDLNTYHHIITAAGSYYLTGNLDVSKTHGIRVTVPGVTIDLNGFEVRRTAFSGGNGILIEAAADRCMIKNGFIRGFAIGIGSNGSYFLVTDLNVSACTQTGISATDAIIERCTANGNGTGISVGGGSVLSKCRVVLNTVAGIQAGLASSLTDCIAQANTIGISASTNCTLTGCVAEGGFGSPGISIGTGSSMVRCVSRNNQSNSATSAGITAGSGCTMVACSSANNTNSLGTQEDRGAGISVGSGSIIRDCAVYQNEGSGIRGTDGLTIIGCSSSSNMHGFNVRDSVTIRDCTALSNANEGILTYNNCSVVGNTADSNGDAGIFCLFSDNRIQANSVTHNTSGIYAGGTGNLIDGNHVRDSIGNGISVSTANGKNVIIRNEAGNNNTSYGGVAAGNQMAPTGDPSTSSNPFLNILN